MSRIYATSTEYQTYTGLTPPAGIAALLADASRMLEAEIFRLAYYNADSVTGMPTDARVLAAFRDAVCAQVRWWGEVGDSVGAAGVGWGQLRIGTVLMNRSVTAVSGQDSAARMIAPQVVDALQSSDLTPDIFRLGMMVGW